jgi:hypothetical protein
VARPGDAGGVESMDGSRSRWAFCIPERRGRRDGRQDRACCPDYGDFPQLRCDIGSLQSGRRAAAGSRPVKPLRDVLSAGMMSDREERHCLRIAKTNDSWVSRRMTDRKGVDWKVGKEGTREGGVVKIPRLAADASAGSAFFCSSARKYGRWHLIRGSSSGGWPGMPTCLPDGESRRAAS